MSLSLLNENKAATTKPLDLNLEIKELIDGLQIYQRAVRAYRYKYGGGKDLLFKVDATREARRLFRIGVRMTHRIEDFIASGKMEKAQKNWRDEACSSIEKLSKVEGLGHLRAAELVDSGIVTIDDLYCNTEKLTRQQLIGLEHYEDFNMKIPLKEAEDIKDIVERQIVHFYSSFSGEVYLCGAFRRCCKTDEIIDCIIKTPKLESESVDIMKHIVMRLENCGLIIDTICLGEGKFSGACRLSPQTPVRRLSLRLTPSSQFPFAILFHSGPRSFIELMMKKANEEGFFLNEYSLNKMQYNGSIGDVIPVLTEEEIFEQIKMPFVPPEGRKKIL